MNSTRTVRWLFIAGLLLVPCFHLNEPAFAQSAPKETELSLDDKKRLDRFEKQVEELRRLLVIPGLSAVILKDQKVIWAKGFGFADLEKQVPATPTTLYHIASLTKTLAATRLLQLVEQGKLSLDEPMAKFSTAFKTDEVKVKHLLSHTSEGTPGDGYRYNGNRYDQLTAVIEKIAGKSFREDLVETFLNPLRMSQSVPSHDILAPQADWAAKLGKENLSRYETNLQALALPYRLYGGTEALRVPYPPHGVGAAAGLLSTVLDLAKFDVAIDRHELLKTETQNQMWTAFVSNKGQKLPHALGWFRQDLEDLKVIWHYGHWGTGFSASYVKVPEKNLTLILLANSESLSEGFYYTGGVETSPFALSFLRIFAFEAMPGRELLDPTWTKNEADFTAEIKKLKRQTFCYRYESEMTAFGALRKRLAVNRANLRKSVKINPGVLDDYVGQYDMAGNRLLTVSREGDKLLIDIPRGEKSELFPESEARFFLKVRDLTITFMRNEKGQVTEFEFQGEDFRERVKKVTETRP